MRISDWSSDVCSSDLSLKILRLLQQFRGQMRKGAIAVTAIERFRAFFLQKAEQILYVGRRYCLASHQYQRTGTDFAYGDEITLCVVLQVLVQRRAEHLRGRPSQQDRITVRFKCGRASCREGWCKYG